MLLSCSAHLTAKSKAGAENLRRCTREYLARGGQPIPFSTDDQRLIAKLIIELAPSVLGPLNDVGTTPAVQACDRCGREVAPALLTETVSGDYVCGACADQSQREHRIGNDDPHDPRPEEAPPRDTHAAAMTPLSTRHSSNVPPGIFSIFA